MVIATRIEDLKRTLIDDEASKKIVCTTTYAVLGLVALVMTVMNITTGKGLLTLATGIFTVLCVINVVLALLNARCLQISMRLFAVEVLVLFSYFLISGNPDGFSAIWVCMLPSLGMFFFGREKGSLLCVLMFVILVFLLWTPFGNGFVLYEYTDTFRMRFPVLFLAFHLLALLLETLRRATYEEMRRMETLYRELSAHDPLTGVFNRQGMYSLLSEDKRFKRCEILGVVMLDIDHFKELNDTYGHKVGDEVLMGLSKLMEERLNAMVCRWGGEEFVAVFTDNNVTRYDVEGLRRLISETQFVADRPDIAVTASLGVASDALLTVNEIDTLIARADAVLYKAKKSGRNKAVYEE